MTEECFRPPLRFAYADPPYVGRSGYYDHEDRRRWDDPAEHGRLAHELAASFDGWALSTSSSSLAAILPIVPAGTRVAAWVKPFAAFKPGVRVAYAWEPVLWSRTAPRRPDEPVGRDYLAAGITLRRGFIGAKPDAFNRWILTLLGWLPGDELVDLFPGTGGMAHALEGRML